MLQRLSALLAIFLIAATLLARDPEVIPVRLAGFDSTLQKVGKIEAQRLTLELMEGRKAGTRIQVHILPSRETGRFVGEKIFLRLPLSRVRAKNAVFFAGELLDRDPAVVASDNFSITVPFKDGAAERYSAGRSTLDGLTEINGTVTPPDNAAEWMTANDAITLLAKVAPDGVQGSFVFEIRAMGRADGVIWLNSEPEYRSPQSLNVAIPPHVAADFKLRHQAAIEDFLKGRKVVVRGIVQRVKIQKSKPEDFYYQNQIHLWSAHQIRMLE